jgi:hypothetical protein
MGISKILLLALIAFVSTKNFVFIGDSRTVGIAVYLFGYSYYETTAYYGTGSNVVGTKAVTYSGHSVKAVCETGASYAQFVNSNKAVYKGMHKALSESSSGTQVILWLGVNGLDATGTFNLYKNLANKYRSLRFNAISITGVVPSKAGISNDRIKSFNDKLKSMINNARLSNLKYKSILLNDDPTRIVNNGYMVLNVNAATTDAYGLHYKTEGYRAIFNAMINGL